MIYYIRDDNNHLIGFRYNGETYYYVKNAQEDIIGILDSNYNKIATYEYDAWGKIVFIKDENGNEITDSNHIAIINPFRYRSYYYDEETKLYYLNSRYYNPNFGRFMNADNYISTDTGYLGYNMYAYCNNNIIYSDPTGHFITFGLMLGIAITGTLILGNTAYQGYKAKQEINKVQKKKAPDKTKKLNDKLKKSVDEIQKESQGQNPIQKLSTFTNAVKTGSKYDLKNQSEWQQTISYNGIVMEPQDIGNFHFGYLGRAMGYDIDFLTAGAGGYQLYEHWDNPVTYLNCFSLYTCDDPRDNYYIRLGAIAYDKSN